MIGKTGYCCSMDPTKSDLSKDIAALVFNLRRIWWFQTMWKMHIRSWTNKIRVGTKYMAVKTLSFQNLPAFVFYTLVHRPPGGEKHFVVSNRFTALLNCRLNIEAAAGLVWQSDYSSWKTKKKKKHLLSLWLLCRCGVSHIRPQINSNIQSPSVTCACAACVYVDPVAELMMSAKSFCLSPALPLSPSIPALDCATDNSG